MQEGDCKITVDGVEYDGNEDDDVRHAGRFLTPFFTVTPAPATTFSRHYLQLELEEIFVVNSKRAVAVDLPAQAKNAPDSEVPA